MKVIEIFNSIQGEGCNLGCPANFIRLAGCNLHCEWCDTDWSDKRATEMSLDDILHKVQEVNSHAIYTVITGGEPLINGNQLEELVDFLLRHMDTIVCIETNGTLPTAYLKEKYGAQLWITCSPKPQRDWKTCDGCVYDELKFVIDDNIELGHILRYNVDCPVWLQPEASNMQKFWRKAHDMAQALCGLQDVRVGVQLHKLMEVR